MDARTIYNRKRKLMSMQRKISRESNRKLVGQEFPVLVEGPSQETDLLWEARLRRKRPRSTASATSTTLGDGEPQPGQMRTHTRHGSARLRPGGRVGGFRAAEPVVRGRSWCRFCR